MNNLLDGMLGYIAVIILIVVFYRSFFWKPPVKQIYDHDKEVGRVVNRLWNILNHPK